MLRYDMAFQSQSDPSLIIFPSFHTSKGTYGGHLTEARWRSFSIKIEAIPESALDPDLKYGLSARDADFVTYRHVGGNYHDLVPFTLKQYLDAKDIDALNKMVIS